MMKHLKSFNTLSEFDESNSASLKKKKKKIILKKYIFLFIFLLTCEKKTKKQKNKKKYKNYGLIKNFSIRESIKSIHSVFFFLIFRQKINLLTKTNKKKKRAFISAIGIY